MKWFTQYDLCSLTLAQVLYIEGLKEQYVYMYFKWTVISYFYLSSYSIRYSRKQWKCQQSVVTTSYISRSTVVLLT